MRIRNWIASLVFKSAIAVIGVLALADQLGIFEGTVELPFFFYFTNISNVAVTAYFIGAVIHVASHHKSPNGPSVWKPAFKYTTMMGVTVTWLIAHFILDGAGTFVDRSVNLPILALHYLIPIGAILDWLLFDKKGSMRATGPFTWLGFPLLYLLYAMIMVNVLGINMNGFSDELQLGTQSRYPYPFIDVDALGIEQVLFTVIMLLVAFVVLGYVFVAIDRILAAIGRSRARAQRAAQEEAMQSTVETKQCTISHDGSGASETSSAEPHATKSSDTAQSNSEPHVTQPTASESSTDTPCDTEPTSATTTATQKHTL